jgi:uncharacterized membrane protein YhhN
MALLWVYVAVSVANVVGQVADLGWLTTASKPLLMPVLLAWLVTTAPRTRLTRLTALALGLSWLGDLALMGSGETWFLLGIGGFALAQITYVVAFLPLARSGLLRERPAVVAPYVAVWLGLMVFLAGRVGELFPVVAVYGALLIAMAVVALGVNRFVAVGAVLFVISDGVIALTNLADLAVPAAGAVVMSTYTAAQGLIAWGVRRRAEADVDGISRRAGPEPASPSRSNA